MNMPDRIWASKWGWNQTKPSGAFKEDPNNPKIEYLRADRAILLSDLEEIVAVVLGPAAEQAEEFMAHVNRHVCPLEKADGK